MYDCLLGLLRLLWFTEHHDIKSSRYPACRCSIGPYGPHVNLHVGMKKKQKKETKKMFSCAPSQRALDLPFTLFPFIVLTKNTVTYQLIMFMYNSCKSICIILSRTFFSDLLLFTLKTCCWQQWWLSEKWVKECVSDHDFAIQWWDIKTNKYLYLHVF